MNGVDPAPNDVLVEFRTVSNTVTKMWCVSQRGTLWATLSLLDPALIVARELARSDECLAWLVAGDGPKPID